MADQFTDLGFSMDAPDAMDRFFAWAWPDKQLVDLEDGLYLRLSCGAEICCWLSLGREDQALLDWDVHFSGFHPCGVAFDEDLALDDAGQSGNIRMLLNPGETELPIVAAVPALAFWPDRESGSPGLAQFACYAETLTLCPQDTAETLQAAADEPDAVVTGHVLGCRSCVNPYSRRAFWHVSLSVCGNTLDLLCADDLIRTPLENGTAITAPCRITAMVEGGVTG